MDNKMRFSRESSREIIDAIIEALILGTIFLVPLWFSYFFPTYNIFELNKTVLFRSLVWLILFFSLLRAVIWSGRLNITVTRFVKRYWLIPLIFISGLSALLLASSDPIRSFFGTIERQQGLSSYLYYFLWFVLLGQHFIFGNPDKKISRAVITGALSATVVSVYGILQFLGIDFLSWPVPPYLTLRTFSSLGQPNFLASWLLLAGPLSFYLYRNSKKFFVRSFWLFAFFLQLVCFFMTGSRGGLIGLVVATLVLALVLIIRSSWPRVKKMVLVFSTLVALMGLALIFDLVSGGRLREMKNISYGSLGARVNIYTAAYDAWQKQPWLGYGLENEENIFIRYYSRDWGVYGDIGQTADRAHNLFLDHLLTGGLVELFLFILLIIFFFSLWLQNNKKGYNSALSNALALGVLAYFSSLLVSFTIVSGEVYFWLFLACLVAINMEGEGIIIKDSAFNLLKRTLWHKALIGVFLLAISLLATVGIWRQARNLIADHYFQMAYSALAEKGYFTALVLDDYLKEQRVNQVFKESYDNIWVAVLSDIYPELEDLSAREGLRSKLKDVSLTMSSRSYQNIFSQARISRLLGDYEQAEIYLKQMEEITPNWPGFYYEQGILRLSSGDLEGALSSFTKNIENLPELTDSRLNEEHYKNVASHRYLSYRRRAEVKFKLEDYVAAGNDYESAYLSNPKDYSLLKKIGDTYYLRGDIEQAISYSLRGYARSPKDYAWPLALASLYKEQGDGEKAHRYFFEALELSPDNEVLLRLKAEY